jgi:hypothetical protein
MCKFTVILGLLMSSAAVAGKAVVVLSLDGVGYQELSDLDRTFVRQNDVHRITPPFPSTTFPSHGSLATGVPPHVHGIVQNSFYEGDQLMKYNNSPDLFLTMPLWTQFSLAGAHVETYSWPNSYGAWHGIAHEAFQTQFEEKDFKTVADYALTRLKQWTGDGDFLFMSWTPGLDKVGHIHGPQSAEVRAAWAKLKADIALFEKAVKNIGSGQKKIQVIYVSDHGMETVSHWVDIGGFFEKHGIKVKYAVGGPILNVYAALPPETWGELQVPFHLHQGRSAREGQTVLELETGYTFIRAEDVKTCRQTQGAPWIVSCPEPFGMHGYLPQRNANMMAVIWTTPRLDRKAPWPQRHEEFSHFVWSVLRAN